MMLALGTVGQFAWLGFAVAQQPELIPGRIGIIKPTALAKFVAKPATGDTFAPPNGNPLTSGGSLRILDTSPGAGDNTYNLPVGGWKGLGNPAGSKGFKYEGAGSASDPCRVVLLKPTVIKGVCKGTGIALTTPFAGEVGIILSLGATDQYCASFGGDEVKNDGTLTKRKNAPAPADCPTPPTTSTSTSTSSTTSTTAPCSAQVGGFCWYIGASAEDCNTTCGDQGRVYDSATASYAGTGGSNEHCQAVLNALLDPDPGFLGAGSCGAGIGCHLGGTGIGGRCTDVPTNATDSGVNIRRACACQ
jgi:hypothetical protein